MTGPFNQQGQQVSGSQINTVGDVGQINVQIGRDPAGLVTQLEHLKAELAGAAEQGEIDQELAIDADYQVTMAISQARQPQPDRAHLLDHLDQAQSMLKTAAAAAGLVTALDKAAELAQRLF